MSGNALCAQYLQPKPRDAAVELGRRLQCLEHELVDCLRRVPVQDLVVKSNDMYVSARSLHRIWTYSSVSFFVGLYRVLRNRIAN